MINVKDFYDIELMNLTKKFGDIIAVNNLNLKIRKGEFFSLVGPSGCGKTTTLRIIAGLEQPTDGKVFLEGALVNNIPPNKRNVNMVFQNYALFPHMTVYENIAFGLRNKGFKRNVISNKVKEGLQLVQLKGYENRKPNALSGGQQQRVALARALVNEPAVLLLDEPLGSLDLKIRKQLQLELKRIKEEVGITFVYVTHDQEEALTLSDRISVMNNGIIEQIGTPNEIYSKPLTKFVSNFIGDANLFFGKIVKKTKKYLIIKIYENILFYSAFNQNFKIGSEVALIIRPEKVQVSKEANNLKNIFKGKLKDIIFLGAYNIFLIDTPNLGEVKALKFIDNKKISDFRKNSIVFISWDYSDCLIFDR